MRFVLIVQAISAGALAADSSIVLYLAHLCYIVSIALASFLATHKLIISLVAATIVLAKGVVIWLGDCPFHDHSRRVIAGAGGANSFWLSDNALYAVCLIAIVVRSSLGSIQWDSHSEREPLVIQQ